MRRLHVLGLVVVATMLVACPSSGPPLAQPRASSTARPGETTNCEPALSMRRRVPGLLAAGKLDRTLRVIARANTMCSVERWATVKDELETLAEIGEYDGALALALAIEQSDEAPPEAKAAVAGARALVANRRPTPALFPNTDEAKAPMRRDYARAAAADKAGDHAAAMKLYLSAWQAWRPNGQALYGAGHNARLAGHAAAAQRLFDRAIVEHQATYDDKLTLATPHGFVASRGVAWSPSGKLLAVADDDDVVIVNVYTGRERSRLRTKHSRVNAAAFSPDGRLLVSASGDKKVRIWDARSGKRLRSLKGHGGEVVAAAFSPDGATVVSASADRTARLWDTRTGKLKHELKGHTSPLLTVAFSADGSTLMTASQATTRTWDAHTAKAITTVHHDGMGTAAAVSRAGVLAVALENEGVSRIQLRNARTGETSHTLEGHMAPVLALAFSQNGEWVVSTSADHTLRQWEVTTGKLVHTLKGHGAEVNAASVSPDGKTVASTSLDQTVRLWSVQSGKLLTTVAGDSAPLWTASFSPDGTRVVVASSDRTARVWSLRTGKLERTLDGHKSDVTSASFTADGKMIASASRDGAVQLWNARKGRLLHRLAPPAGGVLLEDFKGGTSFSADGSKVATLSPDKSVRLWDTASGALLHTLRLAAPAKAVSFSPDGSMVLTRTDGATAVLWHVGTGKQLYKLAGHRKPVLAATFSVDGTMVATGSRDSTLRFWDTSTGELLREIDSHDGKGVTSLAFSSEGATVASGGRDGKVRLWVADSGEVVRALEGHRGPVLSVAFSPVALTVLSTGTDRTIRYWEVRSGRLLKTLRQPTDKYSPLAGVRSASFSPNGEHLISTQDGDLRIWHVETGQLLASMRAVSGRDAGYIFTPDGYIDVSGDGRSSPTCRIGPRSHPLDLCAERFVVPGLLTKVLNGDTSFRRP